MIHLGLFLIALLFSMCRRLEIVSLGFLLIPENFGAQVIFPVAKKYSLAPAPRIKLVASSELRTFFSIEDVKLPPWLDGM